MNASELLRRDKQLVEWWVGVVHNPQFDQVIAFVRAKLSEEPIEREQMLGVNKAIDTIRTISDGDESLQPFPSPGLTHNFDKPTPTQETKA